ncbi:DUF484 family protein [Parasphingopyxis sp. CP4]|uniref:DUF484 family protein n=1 Tax=Parasphingopyxis sp. CP4 TaxID=2724527 RepID=UPI0015A3BC85|nr:DUF484 family protein [Parasphingopyxis sp. CP4]QLC21103.1 DUF484 family protein [Parasphingopyxis sp. CP4]
MGTVIDFETGAVAQLQRRVAEAEEENSDLLAFARGHSGATEAIHNAVLAAISAEGLDHLLHIVTQQWPDILGVDAVSLALYVGETGLRADNSGMQFVERRLIEKAANTVSGVVLRDCESGHPLFGPAAEFMRAEALIRLENDAPLPSGILALGQREGQNIETHHGAELLGFLGDSLARLLGRWLLP